MRKPSQSLGQVLCNQHILEKKAESGVALSHE